MTEPHRPRVKYVIGPDGSPLTIDDLPAPGTKRWVIRRKAEVVAAVEAENRPERRALALGEDEIDDLLHGGRVSGSGSNPASRDNSHGRNNN